MNSIYKNYISCAILVIGALFFCWHVHSFEFIPASITMLAALLLWVAFNIHFDMFNKIAFAKILCGAGLLLSVSVLFLFGIEEVPFPEGALLFHGYGIALSLLGILLSIMPILFISDLEVINGTPSSQSSEVFISSSTKPVDDINDDWEIATEEDAQSDEFEVAA
tara:strand:+ start:1037 stop:1531 length:495 start_codon:yes stop_codon:yes gene_type:complete